jgi:hypothetical protein
MGGLPATRLYGSSIAIVSGIYSVAGPLSVQLGARGMMGPALGIGGWVMMAVGVLVLAHGVVLLSPYAARLGRSSGALMVIWAAIMLLNQFLTSVMPGTMGPSMTTLMSWDPGMVAIAVLMLISGLIMLQRPADASM